MPCAILPQVDFVWLNRNHTAFEWFVDLLLGLEQQQSQYSLDRFLDLYLYMTGIKRFDMKNVGIQMALDMVHEKEQKDMLTGLRTKLQTGRPDWAKVGTSLSEYPSSLAIWRRYLCLFALTFKTLPNLYVTRYG